MSSKPKKRDLRTLLHTVVWGMDAGKPSPRLGTSTVLASSPRMFGWLGAVSLYAVGASMLFLSPKVLLASNFAEFCRFLGLMICSTVPFASNWVFARWAPVIQKSDLENSLLNRIQELATQTRTRVIQISIAEPGKRRSAPFLRFSNCQFVVNREALEDLQPDELDFGLAYCLQSEARLILTLGILFFFLLFTLIDTNLSFPKPKDWPAYRLFIAPAVIVLDLIVSIWIIRKHEQKRIERALSLTSSIDAARSYFIKATLDPSVSIRDQKRRLRLLDEIRSEVQGS